jgi:hypothetical protein
LRSFLTSVLVKRREIRARKKWFKLAWARVRANMLAQSRKEGE